MLKWTIYSVLSTCPSQAAELIAEVKGGVTQDLNKKYGEDESITTLWNTTMEEVLCFVSFSSFLILLKETIW